jgi:GAF domain-containing protein
MSQKESQNSSMVEQLKRLLLSLEAGGRVFLKGSKDELLRSIVDTAARNFGAAAASIALVNEKEQTLEFKVSVGAGNENIIGMSLPMDAGIVGYVAMTGQPIAISDVQRDPRFAQSFAKSTGYVPRSILATPLLSDDRVIGVMEVLDKIEAPSFNIQDMELLGLFARQAAIAIHQSQQIEQFEEVLLSGLKHLAQQDPSLESTEITSVLEAVQEERVKNPDILALADLFNKIYGMGEAERRICMQVLNAFASYFQSRLKPIG